MSLPPNRKLLAEYPNKYFVETGTYRSDAVAEALDAGFAHIRTIDSDPEAANFCSNRFWLKKNTHLDIKCWTGDSSTMLWDMIKDIDEPITFWLDAHWQMLDGEEEPGVPWPLLHELIQIGNHTIKTHTILIDDILILTHPDVTGWSLDTIRRQLWSINPSYEISLVANPVRNNLMVCSI